MPLELTHMECALLIEVLQEQLGILRQQIYHCSTPEFTDELRAREIVLRGLMAKVRAGRELEKETLTFEKAASGPPLYEIGHKDLRSITKR